jgi:hypothetical protein
MTLLRQLGGQGAGGLGDPPQRRHRIAPFVRLDQGQQRRPQPGVQIDQAFAAPTGTARPSQRLGTCVQLIDS